jgi:hypothetical protein
MTGFILLTLGLAFIVIPDPACAYIDPNTGGSIFQALFPILSACAAGYIVFRNRIKKFFGAFVAFIRKQR